MRVEKTSHRRRREDQQDRDMHHTFSAPSLMPLAECCELESTLEDVGGRRACRPSEPCDGDNIMLQIPLGPNGTIRAFPMHPQYQISNHHHQPKSLDDLRARKLEAGETSGQQFLTIILCNRRVLNNSTVQAMLLNGKSSSLSES